MELPHYAEATPGGFRIEVRDSAWEATFFFLLIAGVIVAAAAVSLHRGSHLAALATTFGAVPFIFLAGQSILGTSRVRTLELRPGAVTLTKREMWLWKEEVTIDLHDCRARLEHSTKHTTVHVRTLVIENPRGSVAFKLPLAVGDEQVLTRTQEGNDLLSVLHEAVSNAASGTALDVHAHSELAALQSKEPE